MPCLSSSPELDLNPEVLVYAIFRKKKNSTWLCFTLWESIIYATYSLPKKLEHKRKKKEETQEILKQEEMEIHSFELAQYEDDN